jgi:hypothetical protein
VLLVALKAIKNFFCWFVYLSTDLCLTDSECSNSKIQSFELSVKFRVSEDVSRSSRKPSTPQYPERIHELWHRFYAIQELIACYIEIKKTSKLIKASHRCIDRFINPIIRSPVKFDEQKFPTPGLIWRYAEIYLRQEFRRINLPRRDIKNQQDTSDISPLLQCINHQNSAAVFIRWQVEIHVPSKLSESMFYKLLLYSLNIM